jgi:hypothetical protein
MIDSVLHLKKSRDSDAGIDGLILSIHDGKSLQDMHDCIYHSVTNEVGGLRVERIRFQKLQHSACRFINTALIHLGL